MPAPNEYSWYKWHPAKALTSLRWLSLSLSQEGFYRRLYDWASLAQPSSRRGFLYEHDQPATLQQLCNMTRTRDAKATQKLLHVLAEKGLMCQDENGAWGFTNFGKHQRDANLRVRKDGLGEAEAAHNRDKIGAQSAQNRHIDKEDSKESVQKKDKRSTSVPTDSTKCGVQGQCESGMSAKELARKFLKRFEKKEWEYIIEYFACALAPTKRQAFKDKGEMGDTTTLRNIILELMELADGKQLTYKWQPVPICDHELLVRTMAQAARETATRFETNNFLKAKLQLGLMDELDIYEENEHG